MIDCHGHLVTSSKLLWTVEMDRVRKVHEQRLLAISKRRPRNKRKSKKKKPTGLKAGVDCYLEKGNYQHILDNKKAKYMKQREDLEVKRINRLLLGKLQKVFASDSPFDEIEPEFVKPRSLNISSRRKELIRINMENRSMLRRLQSVEPTMSARRLADEDKTRRKDRKRLQNFIPTVGFLSLFFDILYKIKDHLNLRQHYFHLISYSYLIIHQHRRLIFTYTVKTLPTRVDKERRIGMQEHRRKPIRYQYHQNSVRQDHAETNQSTKAVKLQRAC